MMTKRFSLLFRLKKPRNYKQGDKMLVYMRITVKSIDSDDSMRTELSVKKEFDPNRWNKKAGATGTKEDARALNAYLDTLQIKVHKAHLELIEAKEVVSAEKLKNKLQGK